MAMEISEKLQKYKLHILVTLGSSVVVSSLILFVAPRFVTILTYFWPLLLSTALFLVAVVFFGNTTTAAAADGDKDGEGLLDYVAGDPHHHHHHHDLSSVHKDEDKVVEPSSSK